MDDPQGLPELRRQYLAARKIRGEATPDEAAELEAINASLRESMVQPTPESAPVFAAVEEARRRIAARKATS